LARVVKQMFIIMKYCLVQGRKEIRQYSDRIA